MIGCKFDFNVAENLFRYHSILEVVRLREVVHCDRSLFFVHPLLRFRSAQVNLSTELNSLKSIEEVLPECFLILLVRLVFRLDVEVKSEDLSAVLIRCDDSAELEEVEIFHFLL